MLKTAREPLILGSGGAEMKSYASAFQAAALAAFVPAFGWLSSRVDRARLIVAVVLSFLATVEAFYLGSLARVPRLGFVFFVWVGIFSVASIALLWSYANDLYGPEAGERLFPVIAIGAALGSPVGAAIAQALFERGLSAFDLLHVGAALLAVHLGLYRVVERRERERRRARPAALPGRAGGFQLVARSPYLRSIAAMLVLLNVVNTLGEYVLSRSVVDAALVAVEADATLSISSYIGAFYGRYFFWVNVLSVLLQAFVVSRIVKHLGVAGALLALPAVAFGAYGLVAAGAGVAAIRWAKTAENAVDYSVMNTGKQLLWLPTSRDEKYKAKQAIDTFFVRAGDLLAAALVFAGTHWVGAGVSGFGAVNLVLVLVWARMAWGLGNRYRAGCEACPP